MKLTKTSYAKTCCQANSSHSTAIEPLERRETRDPPWAYDGGARPHGTMPLDGIKALDVGGIAESKFHAVVACRRRLRKTACRSPRSGKRIERHACRWVSQPRGTQRSAHAAQRRGSTDSGDHRAGEPIRGFGYRRITALLQQAGWCVGKDRVQRIWRREGLKVPAKPKPRREAVAE